MIMLGSKVELPEPASKERVPGATYRLQFNAQFNFAQACSALDYLRELGVTDIYSSPLFKSAPQSTHGYDVCGFDQCNPELGTAGDFERFVRRVQQLGMGLLLDMVPNHMAASPANAWWTDVLKHGPGSAYARYFDIDWREGKVVLPVLGEHYHRVLESGQLRMVFEQGEFFIAYYDKRFPVAEESLKTLSQGDIKTALEHYNGKEGKPGAIDRWHELLLQQHYRLAYWRVAAEELNYRRFFDVTDLVGLRVELPEVFDASHKFMLELVKEGKVTGLRVDHPDGLQDPQGYFERL